MDYITLSISKVCKKMWNNGSSWRAQSTSMNNNKAPSMRSLYQMYVLFAIYCLYTIPTGSDYGGKSEPLGWTVIATGHAESPSQVPKRKRPDTEHQKHQVFTYSDLDLRRCQIYMDTEFYGDTEIYNT
ncbi:UNVERIFIED_CONTAM: hypothetical protein FKN15_066019 [Acipenser sinensis]